MNDSNEALIKRIAEFAPTTASELAEITDACSVPQHHRYRQITDAERQANHDQEREIYEQSCEREEGNVRP